ncbi:MAG: UDP-N-acetylmuramate--L-alanine ligase [Candidatus Woykebacteria bacterium RIFCSPHIGHO2_12_FULL_43_10]|uniref:UDP-N-acetylmuramate--L-alanine ligase n=2 Tax=Candidatus Woykeibacteriota TaxID=1817899 RepID=A0A1G1WYP6_9BACT|nr:MAG: UDP-N-acetylmuramate--L-alanine ligase [Candidatus Woykebacteria bacterium RIFCSPHIGHO2_01_FULL_43_29]OGY29019.1 MAG: UDP-N-acetylmuramate--L-alanine ligase [Candidatus Woykebacteria bacterium RIFCSPHIGHO2_12_FULL_43_10]OGY29093.1 MAG: UDP-N-acetylmuramate--L-alanine ligase [Candidatus Woykebacteria bacterium RIFCSPHIGHO2_02_FULL_43_16b]OGY32849.1 MAG: UDP-N-acetylmuramate--L-alanine ligase [Candidatus Woykebacteria bacterium RIFCSPLOWO2_01_FULL_43_14]
MINEEIKKIHFIGILGSGISFAASLAKLQGYQVSGCDHASTSEFKKELDDLNINVSNSEDKNHLEGIDLIVISPAIKKFNPNHAELVEAKEKSITVLTWQEFVGQYLLKDKFVIAIAGTHGKGTTTAIVGLIMEELGLDPTVGIGAIVPKWGTNYRFGRSKYFVIEADEFNDNFLNYSSDLIGITNIEMDHPEYFQNLHDLMDSFSKFVAKKNPKVILNKDNELSAQLADRINEENVIWYSSKDASASFYLEKIVSDEEGIKFKEGKSLRLFVSNLHGGHNAINALCALSVIFSLVPATTEDTNVANKVLESFSGLKRRFEIMQNSAGITIVDDYAHHPTAIRETLKTAKQVFPDKKIWGVFQPHMYTRTKYLFDDFVKVFKQNLIDELIVTDIYAAREKDPGIVSSKDLVTETSSDSVKYIRSLDEVTQYLKKNVGKDDVVVIMGAGDVNRVTKELLNG